jgi:hypothetical protein
MPAYQIIRGDSYALRRPLFTYALVDEDNLPFDLSGCTVRTTWKVERTDPTTDPTDTGAVLKGLLVVSGAGVATTQSGLYLVGPATAGTIQHRVSATETKALPLETAWISDVELTDVNGEVFTFLFEGDTLEAIDGITNRTTG